MKVSLATTAIASSSVGGPEIESYLSTSRRILRALGQHCASKLRSAGLRLGAPDGGFYLFPDLGAFKQELEEHGVSSSEELCTHLLEKTVGRRRAGLRIRPQ